MLIGGSNPAIHNIFLWIGILIPRASLVSQIPQEKTRSLIPQADSVIVNCSDEVAERCHIILIMRCIIEVIADTVEVFV